MNIFTKLALLFSLFNMPIFRILIKKGKKTPQIKNRFGGIELEVNAFPCNPDPD